MSTRRFASLLRLAFGSLLTTGGLALAASAAMPAQAFTTTTGTLTVQAAIGTTCTVSNVTINFGTITTGSPVTTSGSLLVNCSNGLAYSLDLDAGTNPTTANANRQMANGANRLTYNIYTSNTYITVFGSSMSGGTSQSFTGTGSNQTITVYPKIPIQAAPPSGVYTDTVTITATF
jgi:spore coat protein U-like protein